LSSVGFGKTHTAEIARRLLHSFQNSLAQQIADRDRLLS
jgi:hypothetical protein